MDTVQKFAAKQVLESQLKNITSTGNSNMPQINWEDYNYPGFFKIIHYQPDEIPANKAPLINVQLRQLKIVLIICIINLVNNILEVALWKKKTKDDKIPATRIVASIFNFIILLPLLLGLFYRLLLTLLKDNSYFNIYKYMQIIFIVIYIVASIIPWSPFNGFVLYFLYSRSKLLKTSNKVALHFQEYYLSLRV